MVRTMVVLMTGLAQKTVALLTVPIPWVLQKGQIKRVSRHFQLKCAVVSLFGARNPNRHHGSNTQTCFAVDPAPSMPQPQAEVGNVQSFDKKEQVNGMGLLFQSLYLF